MGMRVPVPCSILVHNLLAIKIKNLFLKLAIVLNLNFNAKYMMNKNGT